MATRYTEAPLARRSPDRGGAPWLWGIVVVLMLVIAALIVIPLVGDDAGPAAADGVTVRQIVGDPAAFYGKEVTVSGEVDDVIEARVFVLGGDEFGGERLVVVSANPLPAVAGRPAVAPLVANDIVQVRGQVRQLAVVAIEREVGIELDDARLAEFEGRPGVVAWSVVLTPRVR